MKQNNIALYAKALAEILLQKEFDSSSSAKATARQEKIVNNFVKFLIDAGYENKSEEILTLTQNWLLQKQGRRRLRFETARAMTPSQQKMMDTMVKKGDIVTEKINPGLIAGIKIVIDDSISFDASMQSKLQKI